MKKYHFRDELQKRKLSFVLIGKTAMIVRNYHDTFLQEGSSHKSAVRIAKSFRETMQDKSNIVF